MADELAEDLVAAFDALFGGHPGVRAVHAKGLCCEAVFTATPEAAALTRAPHMQGAPVRATVRFSHGSGDPSAHDGGREPRGMAVKFHLDQRTSTDIVALNQPVFIVRTPEELLEFIHLRTPGSDGKIDLAALGAFVGARPSSQKAAQILLASVPIESFVRSEYWGIHAFKFVAADGSEQYGRYRFEPELGAANLSHEDAQARDANFLTQDVIARLASGPVAFALFIQLAGPGDDPTDPTVEWPEDRARIVAGRLEITAPHDDEAMCEKMVFDPTKLCDGIEASNDQILHARPRAYLVSRKRRAKRSPSVSEQ